MKLGPIIGGMNNLASDTTLPEGTARNVVNADVSNTGRARRRKGTTKVLSCVNARGAYSCPAGAYFVEGASLKKFNGSDPATTLYMGITGTRFAWEYFNGCVYCSDGVVTKKIVGDVVKSWGIDAPSSPVIYQANGSLSDGQYLAALTFMDADGVESGASEIVSLNCAGGVVFSNLPTSSEAASLCLYLSTPNGSILYRVATVDIGTASYTVSISGYDENKQLESEFISKPPAGSIIRHHNGRLHIVVGSVVYETLPYSLDYVKHDFTQFPADISVYEPISTGIFVAADKTYFRTEDGMREILPFGAIPGSGRRDTFKNTVSWQSVNGYVTGFPDGSVKVYDEHVAPGGADSAATLIRQQDGLRQAVISMHGHTQSTLAAKSWIDAEVIRRS